MKKTINLFRSVGMLAAITVFAACSKEPTTDLTITDGKYLTFAIDDTDVCDAEKQGDKAQIAERDAAVRNYVSVEGASVAEPAVFEGGSSETPLYLHTSVSDVIDNARIGETPATRADKVATDNFYSSFNVYGYAFEGVWSEENTPALINNESVSKIDGVWQTANQHIWPGKGYVRFVAYAPADLVDLNALSVAAAKGTPKFSYTVPSAVADQKDFLVAATELERNGDSPVKLTFKHVLTAVRFVTSSNIIGGKIKSLAIENVNGAGTFTPAVSGAGAWSDLKTPATFTQTLDFAVSDGVADQKVVDGAKTFMMIPQTLPDNANVSIQFVDSENQSFELTASIGKTVWPIGKTVTYTISTANIGGDLVLEITSESGEVLSEISSNHDGGNVGYVVKSYKEYKSGKIEPVAWTAEYSMDNGKTWTSTRPEWLTEFAAGGTGSSTKEGEKCTAKIEAQTGKGGSGSSLSSAAELGTEAAPYDLSTTNALGVAQSGMTTANCYVVRAGGWYRIPLVYGNAVKNGAINTAAYNPGSVSGGLATFVKHDNNAITDPCLADNSGVVPANATMVWNDVSAAFITVKSSLVKFNATIGGASKSLDYIVFNIPKASIQAGNAVIAVRNSSNVVLWSWHIWVTGDDLTPKAVTNYMNEVNNMMPVNLGWVSATTAGTTTYEGRSCLVRINQTGTTNSKTITVTQKEGSVTTSSSEGNSPFYQWGRKDPFFPSNGTGNTDKTVSGTKWTYQASTSATIGTDIQNPTVHYYNSSTYGPCNTQYNNLWSAKNTKTNVAYNVADEAVVKTVYDPCPAGFTVAPTNAYTGFTCAVASGTNVGQNSNSSYKNNWNVVSQDITLAKGYNFYCGKLKTGDTIFFPAAGYRGNSSGALYNVASNGYYWAAVPNSATLGRYLYFNSTLVYPLYYNYRAYGFPVRPVQEK